MWPVSRARSSAASTEFGVGGHDRGRRGHHRRASGSLQPEHAGEHLRRLALQAAAGHRLGDELMELLRRRRVAAAFPPDAERAQHRVRDVSSAAIAGPNTLVKTSSGPATRRATVSALSMANIFGTCSPTVMCAAVDSAYAIERDTAATPCETRLPSSSSAIGDRRLAEGADAQRGERDPDWQAGR